MTFRKDLISGVVVLLPVALVAYVLYWAFTKLSRVPLHIGAPTGFEFLDELIKIILILIAFFLLLIFAGRGSRTFFGREMEHWLDRQMNRIPAIRMLYNASKVALEMALADGEEYQMPVHVNVTDDIAVIGFKTGTDIMENRSTVFIPTSPNITSGLILYVPEEKLKPIDRSTEEVLSHVLSAGFLKPGEAETEEVESLLEHFRG